MSFLQEFHLSEEALASFATGMREVANSDADVHPNELALIDSLMEGVSVDEKFNAAALSDDAIKENFMLMLALVAVADGKVMDCELEVIEKSLKKYSFAEKNFSDLACSPGIIISQVSTNKNGSL